VKWRRRKRGRGRWEEKFVRMRSGWRKSGMDGCGKTNCLD